MGGGGDRFGENRSAQRANLRPEVGPSWVSVAPVQRRPLLRSPTASCRHFIQQIQGGQQIESIENEREPGNRLRQPRVPSSKSSSIQNPNLLASLNLLEIRIMNPHLRLAFTVSLQHPNTEDYA